jgi:uncharacterized integral membrane protein
MAEADPPAGEVEKKERSTGELVAVAASALYIIALVVSNRHKVKLDFVFFSLRASLLVIIVLTAVLGFAGGYFMRRSRSKPG